MDISSNRSREESQWQYNMGDEKKMNGQFERQYYSSKVFYGTFDLRSKREFM